MGHRGHAGFFHEQPTHLFPMSKPPALLRQCQNVLTGVTDSAKHPPVLSRKRTRRKRLGKIFWGHFHSNKRFRWVTWPNPLRPPLQAPPDF